MARRRIPLMQVSSRRRRVRRIFLWCGIFLAVAALLAGTYWMVFRSRLFVLQDVEITGATYVAPESVRELLEEHISGGRVSGTLGAGNILAWPGRLEGDDLQNLPAITAVNIEKHYFRRVITAGVTERERVGLWCFVKDGVGTDIGSEDCFWFDPGGVLFMVGYSVQGNLTPVLRDYARQPLALGGKALEARLLPNLMSILSAMQSVDLGIQEVRLNDLEREELEVRTHDGPTLLFSLRFPTVGVQEAVDVVARQTSLAELQYIDFRVENKVYYK